MSTPNVHVILGNDFGIKDHFAGLAKPVTANVSFSISEGPVDVTMEIIQKKRHDLVIFLGEAKPISDDLSSVEGVILPQLVVEKPHVENEESKLFHFKVPAFASTLKYESSSVLSTTSKYSKEVPADLKLEEGEKKPEFFCVLPHQQMRIEHLVEEQKKQDKTVFIFAFSYGYSFKKKSATFLMDLIVAFVSSISAPPAVDSPAVALVSASPVVTPPAAVVASVAVVPSFVAPPAPVVVPPVVAPAAVVPPVVAPVVALPAPVVALPAPVVAPVVDIKSATTITQTSSFFTEDPRSKKKIKITTVTVTTCAIDTHF